MIKVIFFAALREQLQCGGLSLECENIATVAEVRETLIQQHPNWQPMLNNNSLLSAVNHDMVDDNHAVKDNDEVAFFPPVTGG